MNHLEKITTLTIAALLLSACSTTYNQNSMIKRVIKPYSLNNGKTLMVGYQNPKPAWQCTLAHKDTQNWSVQEMKGNLNMGGGYGVMKDAAVAYANKNPSKNINYAYLYIPDTSSFMNVEYTFAANSYISYYHCKNQPEEHLNPFSDG